MKCSTCGHRLVAHHGHADVCMALVDKAPGPDSCGCDAGLPDGLAWVQINGRRDWALILPAHRAARPEWPWWEATRLAAMWHHLAGGARKHQTEVVYDIGSEEGDLPALWAKWGCNVVAFEPNPRVWPNIKLIWEANDLEEWLRACFVGFAAQDDHGGGGLWISEVDEPVRWPSYADGEVIGDHGFLNLSERPDVKRTTIDTVATLTWPPTAITIDVEGAELEVLKGATRTLAEHRPKVWVSIHPEFMADMYGQEAAEVHELMADHGYDEQFLTIDHEHHWMFLPR